MSRCIRWSTLVIGLFALVNPLEAQKGGKGVAATPAEYQQILAAGEITGKVARIDHSKRIITVALEIQTAQPGGGNQNNNLQDLARQQQQQMQQVMQNRPNNNQNPLQRARQMQQQAAQMQHQQIQALARNNGNGGLKTQTTKKEFEFQADEKAKVRLMTLPQEYDERGKPKQYTAAELKELKGPNSSLPGYQADFENLSVGQTVKLTVASAKKAAAAKPAKDKDADVEKEMLVLDPTKYRATRVLILKDEGGLSPNKNDPKKKK